MAGGRPKGTTGKNVRRHKISLPLTTDEKRKLEIAAKLIMFENPLYLESASASGTASVWRQVFLDKADEIFARFKPEDFQLADLDNLDLVSFNFEPKTDKAVKNDTEP